MSDKEQDRLLEQVRQHCSVDPAPYVTQARFADRVGVSVDVVRNWVDRGYIPSKKIGKYRMVKNGLLFMQSIREE